MKNRNSEHRLADRVRAPENALAIKINFEEDVSGNKRLPIEDALREKLAITRMRMTILHLNGEIEFHGEGEIYWCQLKHVRMIVQCIMDELGLHGDIQIGRLEERSVKIGLDNHAHMTAVYPEDNSPKYSKRRLN